MYGVKNTQIIEWSHVHCIFQQFVALRLVSELWILALCNWLESRRRKKRTQHQLCLLVITAFAALEFKVLLPQWVDRLAGDNLKSHLFQTSFPSGESQTYLGGWSGLHCDVRPTVPEDAEPFKQGSFCNSCLSPRWNKGPACLATRDPHVHEVFQSSQRSVDPQMAGWHNIVCV